MITDLLRRFIDARPFRPFVICLTDGVEIAVNRPEFIMISPGGSTAIAFVGDEVAEVVPLAEVIRIRPEADAEASRRSVWSMPRLTIGLRTDFSVARLMVVVAAFALELVIVQATLNGMLEGRVPSALGYVGLGLLLVLGPLSLVFLTFSAIPLALHRIARRPSPPLREGPSDPPDARPQHGTA